MGHREDCKMAKKPLTDSQKYQRLRGALRRVTMQSYPVIAEAKLLAKRILNIDGKPTIRYICNVCNEYFKSSEVAVDHVLPAGSLKSQPDLHPFLLRLFCNKEGLQVLCNECHDRKTYAERYGVTLEEAAISKKVIEFGKLSVNEQKKCLQSLYDDVTITSFKNAEQRKAAYRASLLGGKNEQV